MSAADTHNPILDAALRYAEMGYRVFPCVPGQKRPLTEHGCKDATSDPARIKAWWTAHPDANVAIATDGLAVIDVDGQDNPWLADDTERAMSLMDAPLSLTPNGGQHRFFRQPEGRAWRNSAGKLAPHVDVRAQGGYVLAPPSRINDVAYRWGDGLELPACGDLPEPPAWLGHLLDTLATGAPEAPSEGDEPAEGNAIPSGQRNATLARMGGSMRRFGMTEAEIRSALLRANADRCLPPLPEREVRQIASSVTRYKPDAVSVALVEDHYAQDFGGGADPAVAQDPGPPPLHLMRIPGLVSELMDHTLETAPYPQVTLSFAGALSLMAFLAGRRVRDPLDNRTNMFILSLANSGTGTGRVRRTCSAGTAAWTWWPTPRGSSSGSRGRRSARQWPYRPRTSWS